MKDGGTGRCPFPLYVQRRYREKGDVDNGCITYEMGGYRVRPQPSPLPDEGLFE